jgi:cytochrome b
VSQRILVWDLPTRVFHWALAASFLGAFLTSESERARDLHVLFGYTMVGLIAFRVVWAFVGTRYARFGAIAYGPAALRRYAASLLRGRPERYVGHNPPGALAIPALLGMVLLTAASGYAVYEELGGEWLEEAHEVLAFATLALVGVHVAGVLASSVLHRENLVRSMLTGTKRGSAAEAIAGPRRVVAFLLVAALAVTWGSSLAGRDQGKARGKRAAVAEALADAGPGPGRARERD